MNFTGNTEIGDKKLNISSPYQIFKYFFNDDLFDYIVYEITL